MNIKKVLDSLYYQIDTPEGTLHIHIDHKGGHIDEVFIRIAPIGTPTSNLTSMLGVFISEALKRGLPLDKAIKHLNTSKSSRRVLHENVSIETIEQAIGIALENFRNKHKEN